VQRRERPFGRKILCLSRCQPISTSFSHPSSAESGRKSAPGPDIEQKILDAAEFVFGHFGFRGTTTALIAKKASIAKPPIYY
jgi:hypothetical protein